MVVPLIEPRVDGQVDTSHHGGGRRGVQVPHSDGLIGRGADQLAPRRDRELQREHTSCVPSQCGHTLAAAAARPAPQLNRRVVRGAGQQRIAHKLKRVHKVRMAEESVHTCAIQRPDLDRVVFGGGGEHCVAWQALQGQHAVLVARQLALVFVCLQIPHEQLAAGGGATSEPISTEHLETIDVLPVAAEHGDASATCHVPYHDELVPGAARQPLVAHILEREHAIEVTRERVQFLVRCQRPDLDETVARGARQTIAGQELKAVHAAHVAAQSPDAHCVVQRPQANAAVLRT